MITFTAVDFFQVLDLENYDLDIFNMASTEGLHMETIGGIILVCTIVSDNTPYPSTNRTAQGIMQIWIL
jgi:hypothetical protein